jgi:uncharacterized protein (TIGR02594 family)
MTKYNTAILETAGQHVGTEEWPGAKHNPAVMAYYDQVGHGWVKEDEVPWCAAFVGAVLAQVGLPHTGKLNARSYLNYGTDVSMRGSMPGDIVVFWRKDKNGPYGHVAFLVSFKGDKVIVRGGNQRNTVNDSEYDVTRILSIRRADGGADDLQRPIVRQSANFSSFALDVQKRLHALGYFVGKLDGIYLSRTSAAVTAFQVDNNLEVDGIVGRETWAALDIAKPRPLRTVTKEEVIETSETAQMAETGKKVMGYLEKGVGTALPGGIALEYQQAAKRAESALETIANIFQTYWPYVLFLLALFIVARYGKRIFGKIVDRRHHDAVTGRNAAV